MALAYADIFGDEDEEAESSGHTHADREWNKLQNEFTNAGFREGAIAGKEAALQDGFDDGFASAGAPAGRALGVLRGQAAAALAIVAKDPSLQELAPELRDIAGRLSNVHLHELVKDEPAATASPAHPHSDLISVARSQQRSIDELEVALGQLGSSRSKEGIDALRVQLAAVLQRLGLTVDN